MKEPFIFIDFDIAEAFPVHSCDQRLVIFALLQFDADERRAAAFIIFLRIFKPGDIVGRPEHFI